MMRKLEGQCLVVSTAVLTGAYFIPSVFTLLLLFLTVVSGNA